jgi:hypothetical protein
MQHTGFNVQFSIVEIYTPVHPIKRRCWFTRLLDVHGLAGVVGVVPCDRHRGVRVGCFGPPTMCFTRAVEKQVKNGGGIYVSITVLTYDIYM